MVGDSIDLYGQDLNTLINFNYIIEYFKSISGADITLDVTKAKYRTEGASIGAALEIIKGLKKADSSEFSFDLNDETIARVKAIITENKDDLDAGVILENIFPGFFVVMLNTALEGNIGDLAIDDDQTYYVGDEFLAVLELLGIAPKIMEDTSKVNGADITDMLLKIGSYEKAVIVHKAINNVFRLKGPELFGTALKSFNWDSMDLFASGTPQALGAAIDFGLKINNAGSDFTNMTTSDLADIFKSLGDSAGSEMIVSLLPDMLKEVAGDTAGASIANDPLFIASLSEMKGEDFVAVGNILTNVTDISNTVPEGRTDTVLVESLFDSLAGNDFALITASNSAPVGEDGGQTALVEINDQERVVLNNKLESDEYTPEQKTILASIFGLGAR
jgi:hypothetical protein